MAAALKVPSEAIQNFDEEAAITIISNTFNDHAIGYARTYTPTFNPIDKVVQLYDEKIELYERMLKDKQDMTEQLQGLLKK